MTKIPAHTKARQNGLALITSLLLLVIMTLLALSMFRSFGLSEKIAGNTREKQRSLQAAQSALQFGEFWLSQGNGTTGINCTAAYDASTPANISSCSNALSSPQTLPWTARIDYLPPGMTVLSGGGVVTNGGDINYLNKPSFYIYYMGLDQTGQSMLYQVSAAGYGGTTSGASVLQSTYAITPKAFALDNP